MVLVFIIVSPCASSEDKDFIAIIDQAPLIKQEKLFQQIQQIENPDERAVQWLIFFKRIIDFYPNFTDFFLEKVNDQWVDDYPNKKAVLLMNKSELDTQNGDYQKAKKKAFQAIDILTANSQQTIHSQQLLCLANNLIARYSKYTKEEEDGLSYCYRALELAENTDFTFGKVLVYNQLGLSLIHI